MSLLRFMGIKNSNTQDQSVSGESDDTETMKRIAIKLEALPEEQASYLSAFAYLLGRVAHADSNFDPKETATIQEIVKGLGHLSDLQATMVVEIVRNQVRLFGATENFLVSRRFKEIATPDQCVELLDCIFAVSAADKSISVLEEGQAGQIAKELGLTHDEFVAARITYKEHLETVRKFRAQS